MGMTLDQAKSAAMAVLGKTAKIPDPKTNITKLSADFDKAKNDYYSAVDVLQSKILALQNVISTSRNALKQYQDQIGASTFGLDEDAAGNKDKISKAEKIMDGCIDERMKLCDTEIKNLDELDKHSMALAKYKSP
jgi:hypothetical protein